MLLPGAVSAAALAAPPAGGAALHQIFAQCPSGHLSGGFSVAQLQQALSVMPAAVSQYTSCPDVVQTALIRTRHLQGVGAVTGGHSSFLSLPVIAGLAVLLATGAGLGVMALRKR